jgi:hypothetical protein
MSLKGKELNGGAVVEECYYTMEKRLFANQGGGDDAKCNFGGVSVRMLRIGHKGTTAPELHKYYDAVRISITSMSKYPWFVSTRSLHPGTHVSLRPILGAMEWRQYCITFCHLSASSLRAYLRRAFSPPLFPISDTVCVVTADCPKERGYVLRVAMVKSKRFWA